MHMTRKFRPMPFNELGKPMKKFSETFSAVTLFEQKYFAGPTNTEQSKAEPSPNPPKPLKS